MGGIIIQKTSLIFLGIYLVIIPGYLVAVAMRNEGRRTGIIKAILRRKRGNMILSYAAVYSDMESLWASSNRFSFYWCKRPLTLQEYLQAVKWLDDRYEWR